MENVPDPTLQRGEVLVRTKACGICGTDIHIVDGWGYTPQLPHILGHEPAGVVAAVGAAVTTFKAGDRVVPNIFYTCGQCFFCRTNRETLCINLQGILGVLGHPGGYAEYFKVPARQLFHLPDSITFEAGSVIADAVVCAVHAVLDRARLKVNEAALVLGVGGVGLSVLQVAKVSGARVIAVDLSEEKLDQARELGAEQALLFSTADIPEKIAKLTDGLGADAAFDCVGAGETLALAIRCLRRGGRLITIGYTTDRYPLEPREITVKELEIRGSRSGGRQNTLQAIQLVASGQVKPLLGAIMPLGEANEALERLRKGQVLGRIVLKVD